MRPKTYSFDVADEDTDGFANDVNTTAGNPFTLAATAPSDGLAHKVVITPSGAVTGNYTLTGTDADGKAQSETLATDTTNAVTSVKHFKTLTQVLAPSGIGSETVDIGWADEVAGPTIPLDVYANNPLTVHAQVVGTLNYDIEVTGKNVQAARDDQSDLAWVNDGNFTNKSATVFDTLAEPGTRAFRVALNSYSSGAELHVHIAQSGLR